MILFYLSLNNMSSYDLEEEILEDTTAKYDYGPTSPSTYTKSNRHYNTEGFIPSVDKHCIKPKIIDTRPLDERLSYGAEFTSPIFGSLLSLSLIGAGAFVANAFTNQSLIEIQETRGEGLNVWVFMILMVISAILVAHCCYRPYVIDTENKRQVVLLALFLYILAQAFWSTALFHSQIDRGTATFSLVFLLSATVWLTWVCYNLNKSTIFVSLLLLVWTLYLCQYTFMVNSHPWNSNPINFLPLG